MKNVKKNIMIFGAVVIALLMMSTITAVPGVQSKPVMDQIQQKEAPKNELVNIYNVLNADGKLVVGSQQNLNLDPTNDLEKLYDEEGFLNHIVSDEVIQFLNDNYNSIVSDSLFQDFYNSESVQEFIQSDGFIVFMNSDEVQYMLDHFNPDSSNQNSQNLPNSQEINVNGQVVSVEQITGELQGTAATTGNAVIVGSTTPSVNVQSGGGWFPGEIIILVCIYLLIGIITWIPAAIIGLLLVPQVWLTIWLSLPGFIDIISFPVVLLLTLAAYLIVVVFWPLIWIIVFFAINPPPNPFP